jgi:polyisoprenoid-binding protein YceI
MTTRTWNIDTSHSAVGFAVRHLMISKVRGQFATWTGALHLDDGDLTRSSVEVEIDVGSIDTKEAKRDAHLRSADFFDAEHHSKMTFKSTKVLVESGKVAKVIGDLTIRGTTREVTLEVDDLGRAKDPWGGERAAFEARTRINRRDFGLTWNVALETGGIMVGDKIDIAIDIEAVAAQVAAQPAAPRDRGAQDRPRDATSAE